MQPTKGKQRPEEPPAPPPPGGVAVGEDETVCAAGSFDVWLPCGTAALPCPPVTCAGEDIAMNPTRAMIMITGVAPMTHGSTLSAETLTVFLLKQWDSAI